MPVNIADMIEYHGVRLALSWPQHPANLLQVEPERLRGA